MSFRKIYFSSISIFYFVVQSHYRPACAQRGGGFTQAGASQRLGREPKATVRHKVSDELHPRLRETARWAQAFFYVCFTSVHFSFST
jgi:hypothetical protein